MSPVLCGKLQQTSPRRMISREREKKWDGTRIVDLYAGRNNECHQNSFDGEAKRSQAILDRSKLFSRKNMIKYVILLSTLACLSHCQRPTYAGTAGRYPLVLPQYTKTPAAASVGNRIDSQDTITTGIIRPAASAAVTTTAVPLDLPVEAHGDADLVNRIMTWPRDKQPFWYINQQQINAHRGVLNVAGTATQPPQTDSRSFFAG